MIDCSQVLSQLHAYLDNELDAPLTADLKKHIQLCRVCMSCAEFEAKLREMMRKKTHSICPEKLKARIKNICNEIKPE